ncbi:hypothetical protein BHE74_00052056 [Ensete ventricosum]|nr:hypothetical protein BHE74_00052056 [Ensete ventricosum]
MSLWEDMEKAFEACRSRFSLLFFFSAAVVVLLAMMLKVLRSMPWWCSCPVCEAYVTNSWADSFDNLCDWYAHLLRESPTRTIHIHVLRNTVTANPDNVEHMLRARFDNYPKGKPFSAILGDLLGRGIFNVDGDFWRFQRKMASAELGGSSVRFFASCAVAAEVRGRLLPLLDIAAAAMCKISFGLDPGCLELSLPMSDFAAAFDKASRLSAWRATATMPLVWKAKRLLNRGSERELGEAIGLVNLLAKELIRQRRKLGFSSNHDLLSRFMACVDDDDDDKYLRDIIISFLLAGRDTVASALTCFFFLLSRHPDVRSAIRDEIDRVLERDAVTASYDQLRDLQYVHAAIYESMRLYPPVQFDSKFCLEDDVLPDGTAVRRGTRVTYHAYAMGRMEELWGSDCSEFQPNRWLRNGAFNPESPYKYPVFQGGVRVCLGKEMALMEMKTVIAAVVRQFDVEVISADEGGGENRPPKFAPGLTASLKGGLPVRVRRREESSAEPRRRAC